LQFVYLNQVTGCSPEENDEEEEGPKLDPHLRETLHILQDYIQLLDSDKQIARKLNG
jgi:hypothetical protein